MVAPHSRTNNRETFLSRPLVFLRGREIFTRGRDVNAPFRETFSISMVQHLVLPLVRHLVRLSHQKMATENQTVKCQVRQVLPVSIYTLWVGDKLSPAPIRLYQIFDSCVPVVGACAFRLSDRHINASLSVSEHDAQSA